jgi:hypothetical protein
MTSAAHVIDAVQAAGLRLLLAKDGLEVRGSRSRLAAMPYELRVAIRHHQRALIEILAAVESRPSPVPQLPFLPVGPAKPANDNAARPKRIAPAPPKRERYQSKHGRDRLCCQCAARVGPDDGPLPYSWDVHWHGGEMLCTCSPECRAAAGFRERKPVPLKVVAMVRGDA